METKLPIPIKKISTSKMMLFFTEGKAKSIEASLNNGVFNATHFIYFRSQYVYEMGIDSRIVKWRIKEFVEYYKKAYWKLDQIFTY